jgi:hypothetical protein
VGPGTGLPSTQENQRKQDVRGLEPTSLFDATRVGIASGGSCVVESSELASRASDLPTRSWQAIPRSAPRTSGPRWRTPPIWLGTESFR